MTEENNQIQDESEGIEDNTVRIGICMPRSLRDAAKVRGRELSYKSFSGLVQAVLRNEVSKGLHGGSVKTAPSAHPKRRRGASAKASETV